MFPWRRSFRTRTSLSTVLCTCENQYTTMILCSLSISGS